MFRLILQPLVAVLATLSVIGCAESGAPAGPGGIEASDTAAESEVSGTNRCDEPSQGRVQLPADDARHDVPTEWWYWTGHLKTADGRWFGFHFTFVAIGDIGHSAVMLNFGLTDVQGGTFHHWVELGRELAAPASGFDLQVGGSSAVGGGGNDVLHGEHPNGAVLDLQLEATKAPVFQHGDGYMDYGAGLYTYYYTRPRMRATGSLVIGGETLELAGDAWFDHQWGALAGGDGNGGGWDWFGLQLDDGRELTIAQVRTSGRTYAGGTSNDAQCVRTLLDGRPMTLTSNTTWTSPATGCEYPMGWTLDIDGEVFVLEAVVDDQEVVAPLNTYWEGAATISGAATGRAYVEMMGYCQP